ncbi:hypothetical protein GEMRC1_000389 [Eukaryota sp. GEM-RC1]
MTFLPSEEWKSVCEVVEVLGKTCARIHCKLCDQNYSVNRWAMEGHYIPNRLPKRPIKLCSALSIPQNKVLVGALESYLATHSRKRRTTTKQSSSSVKRAALPTLLSPDDPPNDVVHVFADGTLPSASSPIFSPHSSPNSPLLYTTSTSSAADIANSTVSVTEAALTPSSQPAVTISKKK